MAECVISLRPILDPGALQILLVLWGVEREGQRTTQGKRDRGAMGEELRVEKP